MQQKMESKRRKMKTILSGGRKGRKLCHDRCTLKAGLKDLSSRTRLMSQDEGLEIASVKMKRAVQ